MSRHFKELVSMVRDHMEPLTRKNQYTEKIRDEDSPPSAVMHGTLDGKEYVVIVQPTNIA